MSGQHVKETVGNEVLCEHLFSSPTSGLSSSSVHVDDAFSVQHDFAYECLPCNNIAPPPRLRPVPEAGGRDAALCEAVHHGREAGPEELRPVRLAGETGAADQEVPADGGDRLPGARHEGERTLSLVPTRGASF